MYELIYLVTQALMNICLTELTKTTYKISTNCVNFSSKSSQIYNLWKQFI